MPMIHDGNEVLPQLPDGEPADLVYYTPPGGSRTLVAQAIRWLDSFEHEDLDAYWHIRDTGQATQPFISSSGGWDGYHRAILPDNNPNAIYSTSSMSGNQSQTIEHYFPTGEIAEIYFHPETWSSASLFRFYTGGTGTTVSDDQLVIPFDGTDYWRLEYRYSGGWDYYGSISGGAPEEGNLTITTSDWHRLVIDKSAYPDIAAHLWNAETDTHVSTLQSDGGTGDPNNSGLGFWWNPDTQVSLSKMNLIDADDI